VEVLRGSMSHMVYTLFKKRGYKDQTYNPYPKKESGKSEKSDSIPSEGLEKAITAFIEHPGQEEKESKESVGAIKNALSVDEKHPLIKLLNECCGKESTPLTRLSRVKTLIKEMDASEYLPRSPQSLRQTKWEKTGSGTGKIDVPQIRGSRRERQLKWQASRSGLGAMYVLLRLEPMLLGTGPEVKDLDTFNKGIHGKFTLPMKPEVKVLLVSMVTGLVLGGLAYVKTFSLATLLASFAVQLPGFGFVGALKGTSLLVLAGINVGLGIAVVSVAALMGYLFVKFVVPKIKALGSYIVNGFNSTNAVMKSVSYSSDIAAKATKYEFDMDIRHTYKEVQSFVQRARSDNVSVYVQCKGTVTTFKNKQNSDDTFPSERAFNQADDINLTSRVSSQPE